MANDNIPRETTIIPIQIAMLLAGGDKDAKPGQKRPNLLPSVVNDSKLLISVHNHHDAIYENISFSFYVVTIVKLMDLIREDSVNEKEPVTYTLASSRVFNDVKKTAELLIIRNKEGMWALSLIVPNKGRVIFPFTGIAGTQLLKNGREIEKNYNSKLHLFAWMHTLIKYASVVSAHQMYATRKTLPPQGGMSIDSAPSHTNIDDLPF